MTTVLPVEPADWRVRAACVGKDPEIWHPVVAETAVGPTNAAMEAIILCGGCPVAGHCLDAAIRLGDQHGVWGGMVPSERARYAAEHPTYDGRHREPESVPELGPVVESSRHRQLRQLRDGGQPVESIAAYFGVQVRTAQRWLRRVDQAERMRYQLTTAGAR